MSTAGVSSSNFCQWGSQMLQTKMQQQLRALGQDLQSGNLTAAQGDFATFQQLALPETSSSTVTSSTNSISQEFNQLSQDLQSGNLSSAQQDYANIQHDLQSQSTQMHGHHHHHHLGVAGGSQASQPSTSNNNSIAQLGQALQSGNIANAQQAYNALSQDFLQSGGL